MHDQIICIDKASSRVLPRILLSIRTRELLLCTYFGGGELCSLCGLCIVKQSSSESFLREGGNDDDVQEWSAQK